MNKLHDLKVYEQTLEDFIVSATRKVTTDLREYYGCPELTKERFSFFHHTLANALSNLDPHSQAVFPHSILIGYNQGEYEIKGSNRFTDEELNTMVDKYPKVFVIWAYLTPEYQLTLSRIER